MNSLFVNGKLEGLIMAAGSSVLLLMLSDLLFKGIIIAADAFDAAIRNRERRNIILLMDSGSSPLFSSGFRGSSLPLLITLTISGIVLYFNPGMDSILFSEVICMWGIAGACVINVGSSCRSNAHASLFVRKFYAAFVSLQDRRKALDEACAALPEGEVRACGVNAGGKLTGGADWKEAAVTFDNGMFCGKGLSVFLNLYGSTSADPDESAVSAFTGVFDGIATGIKNRIGILYRPGLILCICMTVYTGTFTVLSASGLSEPASAAILITGVMLSAAVVLFRNVLVDGRLV